MVDQRLILVGLLAGVLGSAAYVRDTLRGTSTPNRSSYALWALAPLIGGAAALVGGAGWAAAPTFAAGLMPALILTASFISRHATWHLGPFDYACGGLSLLAIVLWKLSGSGDLTIGLSIAADLFAAVPTIRKCYEHPQTETGWTYAAAGFSGLCGVLIARHISLAELGFNTYLALVNAIMASLAMWPREK